MATSMEHVVVGVVTTRKYHESRANAVKQTWAKYFDRAVLFLSETECTALPAVKITPDEAGTEAGTSDYQSVIWKNFSGLKYLAKERPSARWYILVDDDTFLVWHSLVELLRYYDHRQEYFLGQELRLDMPGHPDHGLSYLSGGAGQVFSHALLHRLLPELDHCERNEWADVSVGRCVAGLGVRPTHVDGFYSQPAHFYLATEQGKRDAPLGLVHDPISFHHITPDQMYEYEYWLYKDANIVD
eukprot:CAMPEP_0177642884 /NCGR_PEP_ID=MMETSP0447-20121125/7857_1 /TAXON_ID=0 /ORGANISM="Stygamoeba regulata, Strain BSH-02190019" /LENGTH=242 /DNA_ID=CAMNT_0019145137 /DNA_START=92 /DNA_END=817 /DNA_ORIENTATION=-